MKSKSEWSIPLSGLLSGGIAIKVHFESDTPLQLQEEIMRRIVNVSVPVPAPEMEP